MSKKTEQMTEIYQGLQTPEEKLEYLTDLLSEEAFSNELGEEVPEEVSEHRETLQEHFLQNYFDNASEEEKDRLFQYVGTLCGKLNAQSVKERQAVLKKLPEDDPLREKKADWVSNYGTVSGVKLSCVRKMLDSISERYIRRGPAREHTWERSGIGPETTIEEYLEKVGYETEEARTAYLRENNIAPGKKAYDWMREALLRRKPGSEPTEAEVRRELLGKFSDDRYRRQVENGTDGYLKAFYTPTERAEIDRLNLLHSEGPSGGGIHAWADGEGETLIHETMVGMIPGAREDFAARWESGIRSGKAFAEVYPGLNGKLPRDEDEDEPEKDQGGFLAYSLPVSERKALLTDLKINVAEEALLRSTRDAHLMDTAKYGQAMVNVLAGTDRGPTVNSVFTLWALGAKDDIDMSNFTRAAEDPALVAEFAKFCEEHPTRGAKTEEDYRKNAKIWGDIFAKATEKARTYKLPEIDYNDPEAVRKVLPELMRLRSLAIDFSQEKDKIFQNELFPYTAKSEARSRIGGDTWEGMLSFWGGVQQLLVSLDYGYLRRKEIRLLSDSTGFYDHMYGVAASRVMVGKNLGAAAGKPLDQAVGELGDRSVTNQELCADFDGLCDQGKQSEVYADIAKLSREEVMNYLSGRDKAPLERKIGQMYDALLPVYRTQTVHAVSQDAVTTFQSHISFVEFGEKLEAMPDSPEGTLAFLDESVEKGEKLLTARGWLDEEFRNLFPERVIELARKAGTEPMDALRIDGRTPAELWGTKYAAVPEKDREFCYRAEVMKALREGTHRIALQQYAVTPEGKVVYDGEACVAEPAAKIREFRKDLEVYKAAISETVTALEEIRGRLLETHEGKSREEAEAEFGKVGSDYFSEMERTLKLCLDALKDENKTPAQIEKSLTDFQNAAQVYERERTRHVFKHLENGQKRLDISADAGRLVPGLTQTLRKARGTFGSDIPVTQGTLGDPVRTMSTGSIAEVKRKLGGFFGERIGAAYQAGEVTLSEEEKAIALGRIRGTVPEEEISEAEYTGSPAFDAQFKSRVIEERPYMRSLQSYIEHRLQENAGQLEKADFTAEEWRAMYDNQFGALKLAEEEAQAAGAPEEAPEREESLIERSRKQLYSALRGGEIGSADALYGNIAVLISAGILQRHGAKLTDGVLGEMARKMAAEPDFRNGLRPLLADVAKELQEGAGKSAAANRLINLIEDGRIAKVFEQHQKAPAPAEPRLENALVK